MTEAERRVVEAAIRLAGWMTRLNWTWPLEATSLINVVDALADERIHEGFTAERLQQVVDAAHAVADNPATADLSRYHSGWTERWARGENWHPVCRTWHRPENCPEGQNPPGESAPKGRMEGVQ